MVISLPLRKSGTTGALGKVRSLASRKLERISLIMKNREENSTYSTMNDKSQAFIEILTKRGILGNPAISDEKARVAKQRKDRLSYHNTQLLLQHYRTLVWVMDCFPEAVSEELEVPFSDVDSLLEQMDLQLAMGNRKLESQMEGAKKTRVLLDRVNDALTVLRQKPGNGEELYKLIYLTYIGPETLRHKELLYRLNLSSRQYYRYREQAITILSIRLWSAPAGDVDFWLEMLTFLESIQ